MADIDPQPIDARPPARRRKVPPDVAPELPAIAKKADDLEAIKKAVEDAAAVGAPLWLSYLFLLFYVALAAGGVKHADLLLESPVELPFLNIRLPLIAFFVLAPILFVVVHAYVMAHFALLSDKARRFHLELRRQINGASDETHDIREGLRQQLPINVFVQFLAGPTAIREGLFSLLLWAVAWISLVAGPVLVLMLLQLQFLPYHDSRVAWVHRGALIADLIIIWCLWMKILSGRSRGEGEEQAAAGRWPRFWNGFLWWSRNIVAWPLTGAIVAFSVLIATFPGEWREWPYSLAPPLESAATTATRAIFGEVDPSSRRITGIWPVNTLRLKEFELYEALKVDPEKLGLKPHTYILHDRRLEQADLRAARFGKVDLRNARLEGAWLDEARLQGASLVGAHLQRASLVGARLQGAALRGAHLQGALLVLAHLQGAALNGAQLQGASLVGARLQGASLKDAHLQGASLRDAHLQGASLMLAHLPGALLNRAHLQGASLDGAEMEAVDLREALLWRATGLPIPSMSLTRDLHWGAETFDYPANRPWTATPYAQLRSDIEKEVPESELRTEALKRIEALDCARKDLASCDPKAKPPPMAVKFKEADVDPAAYENALAATLRNLVCGGDADAIHILRGVADWRPDALRLSPGEANAPTLIDAIIKGENCPVSAADKARLRNIKEEAQEKHEQSAQESLPGQP